MNKKKLIALMFFLLCSQIFAGEQYEIFKQLLLNIKNHENSECEEKIEKLDDINFRDQTTGYTLLIYAIGYDNIEVVKCLINNGASLKIPVKGNLLPVYAAGILGKFEILKYLISLGEDIDAKNNEGQTALFFACKNGDLEHVKALVELGANINSRCAENRITPLIYAASYGRLDIVDYLINVGAEIDAQGENGATAVLATCTNGYSGTAVLRRLIDEKADLTLRYVNGTTALMVAIGMGPYVEHVRLLLQHNPDLSRKDNTGHTALDYALQSGSRETINLLKSCK